MNNNKVWLVTGASKGLGFAIVNAALSAGHAVAAGIRENPAGLTTLREQFPDLLIVALDVAADGQAGLAVRAVVARFGRIDVLVNNAGYGLLGGVEECSDEEVRRQYETNVFGLLRVTRAVLPYMREQRSGHVINISSLYGFAASRPGWTIYSSTKFAVEGITEGLALELAPLGIHATVVEPGLFRTRFLDEDTFHASSQVINDYKDTVGKIRAGIGERRGAQPGDPDKLGLALVRLVEAENPPVHLPLGPDSADLFKTKTERMQQEIVQWASLTNSTNI